MSGLVVDAGRCVGCKRCVRACAFGGIVVEERLALPTDACTLCGSCVEACPVQALSIDRGRVAAGDGAGADASACRDIWVVAQLDAAGAVLPVTFELIAKARELASHQKGQSLLVERRVVAVLAEGAAAESRASQLIAAGADEVLRCRDGRFPSADTAVLAALIAELAGERHPETVLFGATALGRELAPRIAVLLQTGLTADCTSLSIDSETGLLRQTRPAFGGNLMATIECPVHRPQMATVRPGVFPVTGSSCAQRASDAAPGVITDVALDATLRPRVRRLDMKPVAAGTIAQAKRLVVVGRGIGPKKNLSLMKRLAELLDADLGCTRPLVEAGWLDYAHQVGQTGASVAPELLLSLGVSGAIQHLAGMGGAQTVIAVNEDSSAPIFGAARYAIVGDCVGFAEELIRQLES
ncbi:electron transfer flavoprotein subunit alpha [uncultured Enorma sp.]|uniref:electron transfer flavoprotein subunit alpha n=1 Tax=uncultured Enorma sp. TaxID=1714346 RepID=UPI0028048A7F|nr:electron transfer flavoprotein subunit alpha [uncultured Enorma sp.]